MHKEEFGVEPICRVLSEHGIKIAPSTYYDNVSRRPSKRALRDAEIVEAIRAERARQKLFTRFGARKMWLHLRSQGHDVARCTIERLYAEQGWVGALRRKKVRTTVPDESAQRPADLVDRQFFATRPNELWVADFTYVATWSGMVYVAFIFDVFSRRIVGWRAATRMTTDLVLDTLEHAIWTRRQAGVHDLTGLVHHTDAGSQYVSFAFTERLVGAGVDAARSRVGRRLPVTGQSLVFMQVSDTPLLVGSRSQAGRWCYICCSWMPGPRCGSRNAARGGCSSARVLLGSGWSTTT